MACHDLNSPLQMFDTPILEDIMSIFITSAVLKLVQGLVPTLTSVLSHKDLIKFVSFLLKKDADEIWFTSELFLNLAAVLDIVFTWKARSMMDESRARKHSLKVMIAAMWTILLPIFYSKSRRKYTCYSSQDGSLFGEWCYSSYMIAVGFYLMSNAVNMILFSVPAIGRYIETSNSKISSLLSWWTQVLILLYIKINKQMTQYSNLFVEFSLDYMWEEGCKSLSSPFWSTFWTLFFFS